MKSCRKYLFQLLKEYLLKVTRKSKNLFASLTKVGMDMQSLLS